MTLVGFLLAFRARHQQAIEFSKDVSQNTHKPQLQFLCRHTRQHRKEKFISRPLTKIASQLIFYQFFERLRLQRQPCTRVALPLFIFSASTVQSRRNRLKAEINFHFMTHFVCSPSFCTYTHGRCKMYG